MKGMTMRESNIKEVAQALEAEFAPIATVVDFVHGKEQFLKSLMKATYALKNEHADKKDECLAPSEWELQMQFQNIVEIFSAIAEMPYEQLKTTEFTDGCQRIFKTAKALLAMVNKQWQKMP